MLSKEIEDVYRVFGGDDAALETKSPLEIL